jgi:acyl-CoA thioester hydrolase
MRFELPEARKLTFEMVIPIRWGDMDAMGHVNNTIYLRYLEIVRIEWLHRVAGAPDPAGEGPVWVNYRQGRSAPLPEAIRALIP